MSIPSFSVDDEEGRVVVVVVMVIIAGRLSPGAVLITCNISTS